MNFLFVTFISSMKNMVVVEGSVALTAATKKNCPSVLFHLKTSQLLKYMSAKAHDTTGIQVCLPLYGAWLTYRG